MDSKFCSKKKGGGGSKKRTAGLVHAIKKKGKSVVR